MAHLNEDKLIDRYLEYTQKEEDSDGKGTTFFNNVDDCESSSLEDGSDSEIVDSSSQLKSSVESPTESADFSAEHANSMPEDSERSV